MLFSILVPTKNNSDRIPQLVEGFTQYITAECDSAELIIVDNTPEFSSELQAICSPPVRYEWDGEEMDMLANFDRAINLAHGEFSIIIGDDDAVLPNICEVAKTLQRKRKDAAMAVASVFYWPGVSSFWAGLNQEGYYIESSNKWEPQLCSMKTGLDRTLGSGGCQYKSFLPSVYHGLVRTSVLREIQREYGTAFPGPSPDISNAVLLALTLKDFLRVSSFVVSGSQVGSASAEGASHRHHGSLRSRAGFIERGDFSWPENVPAFFCGPTMWSVSVENTIRKYGDGGQLRNLNSGRLHARCLLYHRDYTGLIFRSLWQQSAPTQILFLPCLAIEVCQRAFDFFQNWVAHTPTFARFSRTTILRGVEDTSALLRRLTDIKGRQSRD